MSTANRSSFHWRRAVTFFIAVALVHLCLPGASLLAAPNTSAAVATGRIQVAGNVTIDGARGTSGQTIFSGSQIVTSEASESIIDLGRFTRLRLLSGTDFTLEFSSQAISSTLSEGAVRGFIPPGTSVTVKTPGGEVITDPSQPAEFVVQVDGDVTKVTVDRGRVQLRVENRLQAVSAGEVFATDSGRQSQSSGLSNRQKVGILGAIGAAATILAIVLTGRNEEEEFEFGDCVIILSGPGSTCR